MKFNKGYLPLLIFFCFAGKLIGQPYGNPGQQTAVYNDMNPSRWGYYEYLPQDFSTTSGKKFPLVIFFHGIGEKGDGNGNLSKVLRNGPPKLAANGKHFPAIVISPQSPNGWFDANSGKILFDYIKQHYPVDLNRVYVTGLSAGGGSCWRFAEGNPNIPAAIVPICGANKVGNPSAFMQSMSIWAFHNFFDGTVGHGFTAVNVDRIANTTASVMSVYPYGGTKKDPANDNYTMNFDAGSGNWEANPGVGLPTRKLAYTLYNSGGHNAWSKTYNNDQMWEWLFAQSKSSAPTPIQVNAGSDVSASENDASITLRGTVSGASATSLNWEKVSGPSGIDMRGQTTKTLTVSNFAAGTYTFRFSGTDANGNSDQDNVKVTVTPDNTQTTVIVNAGDDLTIPSSQPSLVLTAQASSEPNGTITSYFWRKTKGPFVKLKKEGQKLTLTNYVVGKFTFGVTATDASGNTGYDEITITVQDGRGQQPQPPVAQASYAVANAGQSYTVTLDGSESYDADGSIVNYSWNLTNASNDPAKEKVMINFADESLMAGGAWNNLDGTTSAGLKLVDAKDENGISTGIGLSFMDSWRSSKLGGMVTGNDSGIFPDDVINSFYWFNGADREMKITGLKVGKAYSFTFFSSRKGGGDKTTVFTIGQQSGAIDASYNRQGLVNIGGVMPDANGEVMVKVSGSPESQYCYLNSMIIESEGFTLEQPNEPIASIANLQEGNYTFKLQVVDDSGLMSEKVLNVNIAPQSGIQGKRKHQVKLETELEVETVLDIEEDALSQVSVYPNPCQGVFYLNTGDEEVDVKITDMNGRTVTTMKTFGKQRIDLTNQGNQMYLVHLYSQGKQRIIKVIRR